MAYTFVNIDKVKSTAHIETIVSNVDLENGQFVALGALQPDGEARNATPSGDVTKELVFHVSVPLTYEDRTTERDFILKAGKEGRAYVLETGNVFSISIEAVTGAVKNAYVVPSVDGSVGFDVVDAKPASGIHGQIIDIEEDVHFGRLAVIRLVA